MDKKILLIDTDKNEAVRISRILYENKFESHIIDGGAGIAGIMAQNNFDLILCSMEQPHGSGLELYKQLRTNLTESVLPPFVFLANNADYGTVRRVLELGADDCISKPFTKDELIKAIDTQINKRHLLMQGYLAQKQSAEFISKNRNGKIKPGKKSLNYESFIFIDNKQLSELIKINSIIYILIKGDYSSIHTNSNAKIRIRRTLTSWEHILPGDKFLRINKSSIINTDYVEKIEKWFNYTYRVFIKDMEEPFVISQRVSLRLRKQLR